MDDLALSCVCDRWQYLCDASGERNLTDAEHVEIAQLGAIINAEEWERKQAELRRAVARLEKPL